MPCLAMAAPLQSLCRKILHLSIWLQLVQQNLAVAFYYAENIQRYCLTTAERCQEDYCLRERATMVTLSWQARSYSLEISTPERG